MQKLGVFTPMRLLYIHMACSVYIHEAVMHDVIDDDDDDYDDVLCGGVFFSPTARGGILRGKLSFVHPAFPLYYSLPNR